MNNLKNPILIKWDSLNPTAKDEFYYAMTQADLRYINPAYANTNIELDDLEKKWEDFMGMTKPFRRRSDWIMLEYIGCTNETMYNIIKSIKLGQDMYSSDRVTPDDMISESAFIPAADDIDFGMVLSTVIESPNFWALRKEAEDWMKETGFVLIIPDTTIDGYNEMSERELDNLWDAYNMMIKKHRRVADWKSLELFKLTVPQIYNYLKSIYISRDNGADDVTPDCIPDDAPFNYPGFIRNYVGEVLPSCPACDMGEGMARMYRPYDNFTEAIIKDVDGTAFDKYFANNNPEFSINHTDLPAFSPEEMIDMGVYSHAPEDNYFGATGDLIMPGDEILEWFDLYKAVYAGMPITERYNELNRKRVKALELAYVNYKPTTADNNMMQSIIHCGWNPVFDFNAKTRALVDENINKRIQSNFGESRIINLCGFRTPDNQNQLISEETSESVLKPIFIVFEEGLSAFSNIVKKATKGIYSHAAIAFDSTMKKIYSYGIEESINGAKGGFIVEDIAKKDPDRHFGVFAVFVDNEIYQKIKDNVDFFISNAKQTAYNYANILAMTFHIPVQDSNNMICSQFVDRMLKLGGIDITKKSSSLVDPNYLHRVSKANKSIYKLYEGTNKNYKPSKIDALINKLSSKANTRKYSMKEFTLLEETCFYSDSLSHIKAIYPSVESDTNLARIYENVYKPCIIPSIITINEKDDDYMMDGTNSTIDRGYSLIKEFREAEEKNKSGIVRDMREVSNMISREMVYVLRPKMYNSLKECKMAIDQVLTTANVE